jgi:hypothetical protein
VQLGWDWAHCARAGTRPLLGPAGLARSPVTSLFPLFRLLFLPSFFFFLFSSAEANVVRATRVPQWPCGQHALVPALLLLSLPPAASCPGLLATSLAMYFLFVPPAASCPGLLATSLAMPPQQSSHLCALRPSVDGIKEKSLSTPSQSSLLRLSSRIPPRTTPLTGTPVFRVLCFFPLSVVSCSALQQAKATSTRVLLFSEPASTDSRSVLHRPTSFRSGLAPSFWGVESTRLLSPPRS